MKNDTYLFNYYCSFYTANHRRILCYQQLNKQQNTVTFAAGENSKRIILQDSSEIILSPYSSLSYNVDEMSRGNRTIHLTGKAYFSIHHDARHPFIIKGNLGKVQILGTVFQIDEQNKSSSIVYVITGKVSFSSLNNKGGLLLTEGMKSKLTNKNSKPMLISSGGIN